MPSRSSSQASKGSVSSSSTSSSTKKYSRKGKPRKGSKSSQKVKGRRRLLCFGICMGVIVLALICFTIFLVFGKPENRLLASIKWSIDPCEDFHEHACGNWVRPLVDSGQKVTALAPALVNSKAFEDGLKYNQKKAKSRAAHYIARLIADCRDMNRVALGPLKQTLRELVGQDWPVMAKEQESQQSGKSSTEEWTDLYARYYSITGQGPLFNIEFDPNYGIMIYLDSNTPNILPMGEEKLKLLGYLHVLLQVEVDQLGEDYLKLINEEVEFEKELGTLTGWGNGGITLAELTSQSGGAIDFVKLFNKIGQITKADFEIDSNQAVTLMRVGGQEYWSQLGKIISKTPIRVWKNFFGWYYLYSHAFFGKELAKVAYGQDYEKEMKEVCCKFEEFRSKFGEKSYQGSPTPKSRYVLWRIYLDGLVADGGIDKLQASRTKITEMVVHLKDAFKDMLTGKEWLDGQTRAKALEKLEAMKQSIVYSDWIMDDAKLDEWHGLSSGEQFDYDERGFFESYQKWTRHMTAQMVRNWHKEFKVEDWPTNLYFVNALYTSIENKIYIPAGFVQYPNFDLSEPDSVNYGKTGVIIGHELTHGFDNDGSQYDKDGKEANWWSESSSARFNELTQCFVEQYSNITVERTDQKIDGKLTLEENIAENGGVKEAYLAFTKHSQHSARTLVKLPDSKMTYANFTDEQLFFYAYAQLFCEVLNKPEASSYIKGIHPWFKYRVNVALGNMDQFASTFNCPRGSVMNPVKKCSVW